MRTTRIVLTGLATATLALATLAASPAGAGGWAVAVLDPGAPVPSAGQDVEIGFTILQHGTTPVPEMDGDVGIRMVDPETGETVLFRGVPDGTPGHFVATVRVPSPGEWRWEVAQGWFAPHALGTVEVAAAPAATSGGLAPWRLVAVGLAAGLAGLAAREAWRGRTRRDRRTAVAA